MSKISLIGLSSCATGGKDTLYLILEKLLEKHGIKTERFALADILKVEVAPYIKEQYNLSVFTKDIKEKTLIRGILVEHGRIKRTITHGRYFIDLIDKKVKESISNGILPILTDIRYATHHDDEVGWLKSNNGLLIHIERILSDGQLIGPANADESENDPKIKQIADYHLKWPTTDNIHIREDCVKLQLKDLLERIISENN